MFKFFTVSIYISYNDKNTNLEINQKDSREMDIESENQEGSKHVLNPYYVPYVVLFHPHNDLVKMEYYSHFHRWKIGKVIFPRSQIVTEADSNSSASRSLLSIQGF